MQAPTATSALRDPREHQGNPRMPHRGTAKIQMRKITLALWIHATASRRNSGYLQPAQKGIMNHLALLCKDFSVYAP